MHIKVKAGKGRTIPNEMDGIPFSDKKFTDVEYTPNIERSLRNGDLIQQPVIEKKGNK